MQWATIYAVYFLTKKKRNTHTKWPVSFLKQINVPKWITTFTGLTFDLGHFIGHETQIEKIKPLQNPVCIPTVHRHCSITSSLHLCFLLLVWIKPQIMKCIGIPATATRACLSTDRGSEDPSEKIIGNK